MVKSNTSIFAKMPRPCLQTCDFVEQVQNTETWITTVDTLIIPATANSLAKITGVLCFIANTDYPKPVVSPSCKNAAWDFREFINFCI